MTTHNNPGDALATFDKLVEMAEKAGFCQPEFFLGRVPYARSVLEAALSPKPSGGDADIIKRLKDACNGHPHAKIPWPHRLLHDAIAEIEKLRKTTDKNRGGDAIQEIKDDLSHFSRTAAAAGYSAEYLFPDEWRELNAALEKEQNNPDPIGKRFRLGGIMQEYQPVIKAALTPSPDYVLVPLNPDFSRIEDEEIRDVMKATYKAMIGTALLSAAQKKEE